MEEKITAAVVEIPVADQITAERLGFPGSPTVRIDGIDVDEPGAPQTGSLSCRTYAAEGRRQGVPPVELIRRAIQAARNRREEL